MSFLSLIQQCKGAKDTLQNGLNFRLLIVEFTSGLLDKTKSKINLQMEIETKIHTEIALLL